MKIFSPVCSLSLHPLNRIFYRKNFLFCFDKYIDFLGMPWQINTNLVAYNNRNLFFHSLDAKILKSVVGRAMFSPKALRKNPSFFFQLWVTPDVPWLVEEQLQSLLYLRVTFSCVCLCHLFSHLKGFLSLHLGPVPDNPDGLILIIPAKILSPNNVKCKDSGA